MGKRILLPLAILVAAAAALLLAFDVRIGSWFGGGRASDGSNASSPDEASADGSDHDRSVGLSGRPRGAAKPDAAGGAGRRDTGSADPDDKGKGLDGRVVSADGKPAVHVRVVANDGEGNTVTGETDAEGKFHLALGPGRYDLVFRGGRDGALLVRSFGVDGRTHADLAFTLGGASDVGVEAKRDGVGASNVHVRVRLKFDGALETVAEGTTDLGGRFLADAVPSGPYAVEASPADGLLLTRSVDVSGDTTVAFALPPTVRVSGTVYDAESKSPIAATVDLALQTPDGAVAHATATTSGDGRYDVEALATKPTGLLVLAADYAPFPQPGQEMQAAMRSLQPIRTGQGVLVDVPMRRGSVVAGAVTLQSTKAPVPDLAIRLRPTTGSFPGRTGTTAADGTFAISGAGPGTWQLLLETPGWYVVGKDQVKITVAGTEARLDVEVVTSGAVSGSVLLADGRGAAGARVWLVGGAGTIRSARRAGRDVEAFAGVDGSFSIDDVPPNVWFRVRAALGEAEAIPSDAYNLSNAAVPAVRLTLRATGRITGQVTDLATRAPVARAQVAFAPSGEPAGRTGRTAQSDADGRFDVAGLIPGTWAVTAKRNDYLPTRGVEVDLSADTREASAPLTLDPGLAIGGAVVDASGAAIVGATVRIVGVEDGQEPNRPTRRNATTGPGGAFRWQAFRPGAYTLTARASGYVAAQVNGLRGGEERLRVVLERTP